MPPSLALLLWLIFLLALLRFDPAKDPETSLALWVPVIWMFILGTRLPSQWLGGQVGQVAQALEEGNPLDRSYLFVLILLAIGILMSRSFKWGDFFARNIALMAFLSFALVSVCLVRLPLRRLQAVVSRPRQLPGDPRRSVRSSPAGGCPHAASTPLLSADPAFHFAHQVLSRDRQTIRFVDGRLPSMSGATTSKNMLGVAVPDQRALLFLGYGDALVRS